VAAELLGVWITMDGNKDKQIDIMKKKAQVFAAQISTKKVSRNDALYTYNSSFMKTLEYHMAAMLLTEDQWNDTVRPALQATLNAAAWPSLSHTRSSMVRTYIRVLPLITPIFSRISCTS